MSSTICQLTGWALKVVSEINFTFWLSESGEVLMLLELYFDIIVNRISLSREENCYHTDSIRSRGRSVIDKKTESESGKAEGRI